MTIRRAIIVGTSIGIAFYFLISGGISVLGLDLGRLRDFPAYVACLRAWRSIESSALEECRHLRRYLEDEDREPLAIERIATAAADEGAEALDATEEFVSEWLGPLADGIASTAKFVSSRLPR